MFSKFRFEGWRKYLDKRSLPWNIIDCPIMITIRMMKCSIKKRLLVVRKKLVWRLPESNFIKIFGLSWMSFFSLVATMEPPKWQQLLHFLSILCFVVRNDKKRQKCNKHSRQSEERQTTIKFECRTIVFFFSSILCCCQNFLKQFFCFNWRRQTDKKVTKKCHLEIIFLSLSLSSKSCKVVQCNRNKNTQNVCYKKT